MGKGVVRMIPALALWLHNSGTRPPFRVLMCRMSIPTCPPNKPFRGRRRSRMDVTCTEQVSCFDFSFLVLVIICYCIFTCVMT